MRRKILFIVLFLSALTAIFIFISRKKEILDVELLTPCREPLRGEAARFTGIAMDALKKDGIGKFRDYWTKVDEMQYSMNMASMKGIENSRPEILNIVSPKNNPGRVYVYARFPGRNDYDIQFVLVRKDRNFRIAGIYENREFRR